VQLQKSIGDVWPQISSANALQKERQGRVNGGLARNGTRWVKPSAGVSSETKSRGSASPVKTGEDRHETQGALRSASAVVTSPKAVGRSWGRGCNGHRILRRVLIDGRHPGSSRSVALHGAAATVVSAANRVLRPVRIDSSHTEKSERTAKMQRPRERVRRRANEGSRQGCQRLDRNVIVGRKRPRSCPKAVKAQRSSNKGR